MFDADGVLIDSEILRCEALVKTLSDFGVKSDFQEALKWCVGRKIMDEKPNIEAHYNIILENDFFFEKTRKYERTLYKKIKRD